MNFIEFPGLGLKFFINPTAFTIGGMSVAWYGILIGIGFAACVTLALMQCKKYGVSQDNVIDIAIWGLLAALICAKLYYVLFNLDFYIKNPMEIITNWRSGIAVYGSLIGALLAALVYCKVKKLNFWILLDFAIVYFPLGQAIGRWGNFVNQEAFGEEVKWLGMPWRMTGNIIQQQNYTFVHPTFLYESLWCILIFAFLLWFRDKAKLKGEVVSMYFILYGIERAFVEGLRTDSLWFFNFRISQVVSIILVIALSAVFIYRRKKMKTVIEPEITEGADD